MKLLLLTDMPPCAEYTAGVVLDRLCRFLPEGSVACFAAVRPEHRARISPDLAAIPVAYRERPGERAVRLLPARLGALSAMAVEAYNAAAVVPGIAAEAAAFGRKHGVTAVWALLEGQTLIRLARPVARKLGVPLFTQVFDPPTWWLREHGVDRVSASLILREYARALRASVAVAAVSRAMAERYAAEFGVRAVPVLPGLDARLAAAPAEAPRAAGRLVIGVGGQLYTRAEWDALLAALDASGWRIGGREVTIRLTGRHADVRAGGPARIEYLGWAPTQAEAIRLMSEADILYCPCWFDPAFETEARLCFPSKLPAYLAAGRPVLFHGPEYASAVPFLRERGAALCCHSLDPGAVAGAIETLAGGGDLYARLARNGHAAFLAELTEDSMRARFLEFLGIGAAGGA